MTLLIAYLQLILLNAHWTLYPVVAFLWALHLAWWRR